MTSPSLSVITSASPTRSPARRLHLSVLLALSVALAALSFNNRGVAALSSSEADALAALQTAFSPPGWTGTPEDNCSCDTAASVRCSWPGIMCTAPAGGDHVQKILLSDTGLSGQIPTSDLSGLSSLDELDLSANAIGGTIPPGLGDLASLTYLYLYSNLLTGCIPTELADATQLQKLIVFNNSLNCAIPSELASLPLTDLDLSINGFFGSIPTAIVAMPTLVNLRLSENQLSGSIPDSFPAGGPMQVIDLTNNFNITGSIPSSMMGLSSLSSLLLSGNTISGKIPANIGSLTSLVNVVLFNNDLSGDIPASISQLINLQTLSLSSNPLGGVLPSGIVNLQALETLLVASDGLIGPLPNLSKLTSLTSCDLRTNNFNCDPGLSSSSPCYYTGFESDCNPADPTGVTSGATTGATTGANQPAGSPGHDAQPSSLTTTNSAAVSLTPALLLGIVVAAIICSSFL